MGVAPAARGAPARRHRPAHDRRSLSPDSSLIRRPATSPGARGSAPLVPLLQRAGRVEDVAALVPARGGPDLEVEVAALGVAGVALAADHLAGPDP